MIVVKSGYGNSLVEAGLMDGKDMLVGKSVYGNSLDETAY